MDFSNQDHIEAEALILSQAEDYHQSEMKLSHFTKAAWPVLEPGKTYLHNWHIDLIAEYLEAVYLKQIRKLVINMPPRHMKSIAVTVCFPAWVWLKKPELQFMFAAYSERLSYKHSRDRRHLIKSPWYQGAWSSLFDFADDDNQVQKFTNSKRGYMLATSVAGSSTGEGGDMLIIDDPINPKEAASDTLRKRANDWRDQTWSTRKNSEDASEILVMQRLHEKDPSGHVLDKGGWEHLVIPMEATKKTIIVFPISKKKIIRPKGDILHKERFGPKAVADMRIDLGPDGFEGQCQQDPKPSKGGFFKPKWWKRYKELPKDILKIRQYWDTAEEPGVSNDFSVCATIAETELGYFWLHVYREKVAFPELLQAAKDQYGLWQEWSKGRVEKVKIENKSSGVQLYQVLSRTKMPVEKFDPGQRNKVVRAAGAQPTVAAGNCYLPEYGVNLPMDRTWVPIFISEHEKFPLAEHDDTVDATSMAIEDLRFNEDEEAEVF